MAALDFLVALGTLFPIYLNTYHGIRNVDPALVEMAGDAPGAGARIFVDGDLPGEGGLSSSTTSGYADTKPVAPNTTDEGRAKNRRTEFKIRAQ